MKIFVVLLIVVGVFACIQKTAHKAPFAPFEVSACGDCSKGR